jgi:hypothetical protein
VTVGGPTTTTTAITTTTTIAGASLTVRPNAITRGPVLPRWYLLRLRGENTSFSRNSVVSLSPPSDIKLGVKLRLGQVILQIVRVPGGDEAVALTMTVTTGTEVVSAPLVVGLGGILSE